MVKHDKKGIMTHPEHNDGGSVADPGFDPRPAAVITGAIEDMHTTSLVENRFLPERTKAQIFSFIGLLEGYNAKLPPERQRPPGDYVFLRHFYPAFVADRNQRADEVNDPEYQGVIDLAESLLPMTTLGVLCMDGRVKLIHVYGFSAGIGSSIRVPGGLLKEFIRGKDGELKLEEGSNFAELLDSALGKTSFLAEDFDSHFGCAARKGEEAARGGSPQDAGLYSDVLHKREMVRATEKYVLEKYGDTRQLALVQTTFNPITGFLYMGLETDKALEYARNHSEGGVPTFSKDVIRGLIEEGLVISTGELIDNPVVRDAFNEHLFGASWKNDYVKTAVSFWNAIAKMKEGVLPVLKRTITSVYPELSVSNKRTQRELEERAMLILCNAFNAYLHNSDHNEAVYLGMDDEEYEKQEHYEYDEHIEEGIKVSEGGYPPYDIPMFVIFSGDEKNMPANIELASGIVRDNRLKGRIKDESGDYTTNEAFAKAPVPVVMQEIIRDSRLTEEDWRALEDIDWSDLPSEEWDTMTPTMFSEYLVRKGKLSGSIINGLESLRRKMAVIFDKDALTSAHLIDQYKVALPVICDQDRKTHAIIPFVKLGH